MSADAFLDDSLKKLPAVRLTRYFSLLSLILLVLAGGLLGTVVRRHEIAQIERVAEDRNVTMTRLLGNILRHEVARLIAGSTGKTPAELQAVAEVGALVNQLGPLLRGSDIAKVKIYNLDGITVFSTERTQIGDDKRGNHGFELARSGQVASELVHRNKFSAFDGEISDVDLLSSYIPVIEDGRLVAVFEQYQDVTPLINHIERSLWQLGALMGMVLGVLYLTLLLVVRRAQQAITEQEALLEAANRELDQRVAARTSELALSEQQLRASEVRFRSLTAMSSDFYWETDAGHRFTLRTVSAREAADPMLSQACFIGALRWEVPHCAPDADGWAEHRAVLDAHQPFRHFEIARCGDKGAVIHVAVSGDPVFDAEGVFVGYRGVGTDITERKETEARIRHLAFFDQLTGLPNRLWLRDRLHQLLKTCGDNGRCGAVLTLDLDNFKVLNDTRGHNCGDELLKQVALRLSEHIGRGNLVARLGGDEFALVMAELPVRTLAESAAALESMSRNVLAQLSKPYASPNNGFHCTASIGIAIFTGQKANADDLLRKSDMAMYQAKRLGGNSYSFFDPGMEAAALTEAQLESDLRRAIQSAQFELYYQPQVAGDSGEIKGAEALIRWHHPGRGMVSPLDFIPLAERTGLILPLGKWVLDAACEHLAAWASRPELAHVLVAVNVSAQQFQSYDFVSKVIAALERTGANPARLKLELTESVFAGNTDDIVAKMHELKAIGVGFSLDDFGTGYSSLAYLSRLPLDQLKIDRSFVTNIEAGDSTLAICTATISLARSLKLTVVAEGVETDAQRYVLGKVHQCDLLQGYLFGRPVPRAEFEAMLTPKVSHGGTARP